MKKFMAILAAVGMVMMFGTVAFAGNGSPWDTEVPVTVNVLPMTELWMDNGAVTLNITDGGGVNSDSRAVRSVTYLSNIPINVSVQITGDIIDGTYFYIVITPDVPTLWDNEGNSAVNGEENLITFLRQNGSYIGNIPLTDYAAFSRGATYSSASTPVVYAAQISPLGVLPAADATTNMALNLYPGRVIGITCSIKLSSLLPHGIAH